MKRLAYAFTAAAILAIAAPAIADAHGAGVSSASDRGHAGRYHRHHVAARHFSRPLARSYPDDRVLPSAKSLLDEDRDRGVYMGQRHDD